jgi:hypothetical protein
MPGMTDAQQPPQQEVLQQILLPYLKPQVLLLLTGAAARNEALPIGLQSASMRFMCSQVGKQHHMLCCLHQLQLQLRLQPLLAPLLLPHRAASQQQLLWATHAGTTHNAAG